MIQIVIDIQMHEIRPSKTLSIKEGKRFLKTEAIKEKRGVLVGQRKEQIEYMQVSQKSEQGTHCVQMPTG